MVTTSIIQKYWKYCEKTFSHTPILVFKIAGTTFSSDLRKPCWITAKSLSPLSKRCPVLEEIHIYIYIILNRMRSLHSYNTVCVLAIVHLWSCKLKWYTFIFILQDLHEIFSCFLKIHLGTCNLSLVQYIYETVIVYDIQTHPKHVYRVIVGKHSNLYCHHHNGHIFPDMIQFSVLQGA